MAARTYYELLDLPRTATADDIKRAFRREIAKYHPDKVQHLGQEFQEIAVIRAAELTQAYKTLTDGESRAAYNATLGVDVASPAAGAPAAPPPAARREAEPAPAPAAPSPGSVFERDRAASSDLIRRAAIMRVRSALEGEFGHYDQPPLSGFDIVCVPKPSFWSLKLPTRVVARFVEQVDGGAVADAWTLAARMKKDPQRDLCVLLIGPKVAPAGELATAIADQRRRPMPAGGKLVMVPVSTLNWSAHVPTDAPPAVRSLLGRLKSA